MKEIIISQSLYFPNTFYIFREVGDSQYYEIEIVLDFDNEKIKCSRTLNLDEVNYIRLNLFQGKFMFYDSAINDRKPIFESYKKTYHKHVKS